MSNTFTRGTAASPFGGSGSSSGGSSSGSSGGSYSGGSSSSLTAASITDSTLPGRNLLTAATVAAQKQLLSLDQVSNTADSDKPVSGPQAVCPDGTGSSCVDPKLVNSSLLNPDIRLQPDSPAINGGTSVGAPSVDLYNSLRPARGAVDIGAVEVK